MREITYEQRKDTFKNEVNERKVIVSNNSAQKTTLRLGSIERTKLKGKQEMIKQ